MSDNSLEVPVAWMTDDTNPISTDDPWYDLFEGGYIKPEDVLVNDRQIFAVDKAIELLRDFMTAIEEDGAIEVC